MSRLSAFKPAIKWLRLSLGILSLALGLLPFVPAPTRLLWMLGVGVTEWGHLFALIGFLPLLPGWRRSQTAKFGAVLGFTGALLALSSIGRALLMAGSVRVEVENAFGPVQPRSTQKAPLRPAPIVLTDIVLGISCPTIERKSVVYSSPLGNPLTLDLYMPTASPIPSPVVVMIHGGAWRAGDRTQLPHINQYLVSRGYLVAALDYRLAPACKFPAALEDVRAAVTYLKENAVTLGLDPHRIALIGRSAGGHLALLEAYTSNDQSIRGVVAIYAPADLVWGYEHPCTRRVLDSTAVLEEFLGGSPSRVPAAYHDCSPINFITSATPPTLLIHGERDDMVYIHNSEQIAQRLREAGVPHYFLRIPWGNHGCDANLNGPSGQLSVYAIERFLAAVFK